MANEVNTSDYDTFESDIYFHSNEYHTDYDDMVNQVSSDKQAVNEAGFIPIVYIAPKTNEPVSK